MSGADAAVAPFSQRAFTIVSYALCGFGNFSSVGINIGVMSAIAPRRSAEIVRLAPSAFVTGILVTLSSAAVAGIVSGHEFDLNPANFQGA